VEDPVVPFMPNKVDYGREHKSSNHMSDVILLHIYGGSPLEKAIPSGEWAVNMCFIADSIPDECGVWTLEEEMFMSLSVLIT
jgi:hypothetical protein